MPPFLNVSLSALSLVHAALLRTIHLSITETSMSKIQRLSVETYQIPSVIINSFPNFIHFASLLLIRLFFLVGGVGPISLDLLTYVVNICK